MQPQEPGFDWLPAASGVAGAVFGAISTVLGWIVRAARMEPKLRAEIKDSVAAAELRAATNIDDVERRIAAKVDDEVNHFDETLHGLREKINVVEKDSVSKGDFNEFRREMRAQMLQSRQEQREDMADLKNNIIEVLRMRP